MRQKRQAATTAATATAECQLDRTQLPRIRCQRMAFMTKFNEKRVWLPVLMVSLYAVQRQIYIIYIYNAPSKNKQQKVCVVVVVVYTNKHITIEHAAIQKALTWTTNYTCKCHVHSAETTSR